MAEGRRRAKKRSPSIHSLLWIWIIVAVPTAFALWNDTVRLFISAFCERLAAVCERFGHPFMTCNVYCRPYIHSHYNFGFVGDKSRFQQLNKPTIVLCSAFGLGHGLSIGILHITWRCVGGCGSLFYICSPFDLIPHYFNHFLYVRLLLISSLKAIAVPRFRYLWLRLSEWVSCV